MMPCRTIRSLLGVACALCLSLGCSADGDESPGETGGAVKYPRDGELRLNMLQAKATHNSYHVARENTIPQWQYTHVPLDQQLADQGARGVELDTNYYSDVDEFQVYHVSGGLDDLTTCRLLSDCFAALFSWSEKNPLHHPIFVQIEPKGSLPCFLPPPTCSEAEAEAHFARVHDEILSVWPRERIITPDDVKGSAATLREAVMTTGWPALGDVRGKVLFFWNESGPLREAYTRQQTSLDGRLMFAEAEPQDPYAAIVIMNNPDSAIEPVVQQGFIVRTRADSDGDQARANDTSDRDRAFASGAHLVSTDFPAPVDGLEYYVEVPGGTPSRCNPLTAPAGCESLDIENPDHLD